MDKLSVKKYAVWAHEALAQRVRERAMRYIDVEGEHDARMRRDMASLPQAEADMCRALVGDIGRLGVDHVVEETSCLWFIRFCALRYMEVNGYLPGGWRVFRDSRGKFGPQVAGDMLESGLVGDETARSLMAIQGPDALYRHILIAQCQKLADVLPCIFAGAAAYTDLLLPDELLQPGSVLDRLISDIPDAYFDIGREHGQIEIIGWLYQYYISEKHDAVVDPLYGKSIAKKDIPVATQLFTTDWIVRYIVDNSVGRYWIEHHPESQLSAKLKYDVPHVENIRKGSDIAPQDMTVFDPCVGAGHFLVYAIDILVQIYRECGYSEAAAVVEIARHNLYGLDIDARAVRLAYFAVTMKCCQYDRLFYTRGIALQIYACVDSVECEDGFIESFCGTDRELRADVSSVLEAMSNAEEFGSILQVPDVSFEKLEQRISELEAQKAYPYDDSLRMFRNHLNVLRLLSSHYVSVITNPPYMNKFDKELKKYIKKYYKSYSGDLFSVFIYQCIQFCRSDGYAGLMTPNVWMFIKSYEPLRRYIIKEHSITTLVQLAKGSFFSEATVDVCAFVVQKNISQRVGVYFRLEDYTGDLSCQNAKLLEAISEAECSYRYKVSSALFEALPGCVIGYWVSPSLLSAFRASHTLNVHATPRQGMATTDNHKYLRHWYEIQLSSIGFGLDRQAALASDIKWFPYNKGGEFRKWYGNQDYVVNYQHDGREIKHDVLTKYPYLKTPDYVVKNPDTYFSPCLSWSKISSGCVSFRYFPKGFLYDVSGCSIFFKNAEDMYYYAGFLNSVVCLKILEIISPTLNYEAGHIGILPIIESEKYRDRVVSLVRENIEISREDWEKRETSWGFERHPLV